MSEPESLDAGSNPHPVFSITPENFGAVADDIGNVAPEVQPHVIEEHARQQANAPVDSEGVPFDVSIHASGADGAGITTAKGTWRRRRGSGGKRSTQSTVGSAAPASASAPTAAETAARACGAALTQMTFITGQVCGGSEWAPRQIKDEKGDVVLDEQQMLTDAYTNYALAKGMSDLPPGVALSFALIAYAAPRFTMPETRSRMAKLKEWIGVRLHRWRERRAARKRAVVDHLETHL